MTLRLERDGGSSPLTRGKPIIDGTLARTLRLIPAHAGKTATNQPRFTSVKAHPRSRGENQGDSLPRCQRAGSSPLTRGKRITLLTTLINGRLIPAHAGKTPNGRYASRQGAAHPRSRGENLGTAWIDVVPSGSSPLTRGKRNGYT